MQTSSFCPKLRYIMLLYMGLSGSDIFFAVTQQISVFSKENYFWHIICDFISSKVYVSHFKKNSGTLFHKITEVFIQKTCYSCLVLKNLRFSRNISVKREI